MTFDWHVFIFLGECEVSISINFPIGLLNGPIANTINETLTGIVKYAIQRSKYPKMCLHVQVIVLSGKGEQLISLMSNCIILALLDSGILMHHLPISACLALLPNGCIVVDPTEPELDEAKSCFDVVVDATAKNEEVISFNLKGTCLPDDVTRALNAAKPVCKVMAEFMRQVLDKNRN